MAQGIGLAGGYGAGGAALGLEKVIEQRLMREKFEELKRQAAAQEALQQQRHALDTRQFGYVQQRDTADREMRTRERAEDRTESQRRFDIERSEFDAASQERQFNREMAVKEKGEERELRAKERKEDRDFESSERAKDRAFRAASGGEERLVQVEGPDGAAIWVRESQAVGKPAAQATRSVTGSERQALAYFNRAKEASETLAQGGLEERIAQQGAAGALWGQYAPNMVQTQDQQMYRQAQRAFTEARLRKESGAAIPQPEYDSDAKIYFAQPGDSAETIAQKQKARQAVLDGLKFSSGKAYDEFYGESAGIPGAPPKPKKKFEILDVK